MTTKKCISCRPGDSNKTVARTTKKRAEKMGRNIKKNTTDSILRAIKSSAIDCFLHTKSNSKEGIFCYSFGSPSVNTFTYKPDLNVEEEDKVEEQNYEGKIYRYPDPIEIQNNNGL